MTSTAVATQADKSVLNLESAKAQQRFVEAFSKGQLDRLGANEQAMFLIAFGQRIGLRAELGEVMLYQGKPYITLAGRIRNAHASGLLAGLVPRPATDGERRQFGASDQEVLWVCDCYRHGAPRAFRGWGVVNRQTDRNPVAKQYPREMAKKRAKYDALAMAFPPDESLGPLHQKFLEEAEREAEELRKRGAQLMSYDPTEDPDAELVEAEVPDGMNAAADAAEAEKVPPPTESETELGAGNIGPMLPGEREAGRAESGELGLGDPPKRRVKSPQEQGH